MVIGKGTSIAGRYRLDDVVGEGGMGVVWRATQIALNRPVAVKLLHPQRDESGHLRERFAREARAAATVRHRNVVQVIEYGEHDARTPYLVMEWLDGQSLEAKLAASPPPSPRRVIGWIVEALAGLAAIHDARIVHRDLKPSNLFVARDAEGEVVKVVDFGIVRSLGAATITMPGMLGTPGYMAPEQVADPTNVSAATDLFAIGIILFEGLAGAAPFSGATPMESVHRIITNQRRRLADCAPHIPLPVCAVVERALEPQVSRRFRDAREMQKALIAAVQTTVVDVHPPRMDVPPSRAAARRTAPTRFEAGAPPRSSLAIRGQRNPWLSGLFAALVIAGLGAIAVATIAVVASWSPESTSQALPPMRTGSSGIADPTTPRWLQVSEPSRPADLLLAWRDVPSTLREEIFFTGSSESIVALASPEASARSAAALGSRVGAPWSGASERILEARLLRTTTRALVRRDPEATRSVVATVPDGTLAIALIGQLEDGVSRHGERGQSAFTVLSSGLTGWMSGTLFQEWRTCVPQPGSVERRYLVIDSRLRVSSRDTPALLLLDFTPPGDLQVATRDERCNLRPLVRVPTEAGSIAETFVTRTAPDGESLIAVGRWPGASPAADGRVLWSVYALEPPDLVEVWSIALNSGHLLEERRQDGIGGPIREGPRRTRGFWPIRVRRRAGRTFYQWDGATLVPVN